MSLDRHIKNVFTVYKPKRGWKTIYWLVDVHGVIIPGSWHKENDFQFIDNWCPRVLRWISEQPDHRLILWTSSYKEELNKLGDWLFSRGITVDYINCNPEEKNTVYADFSFKPYFNILLDDKAGFDPKIDWQIIHNTLIELGLLQTEPPITVRQNI